MRSRNPLDESSTPSKQRRCYICKEQVPGDPCSFWAGFCTYYDERDYGDKKVIDAKYRDLHRYSVNVCDECAAYLRKKHHLYGIIAWGTGFLVSVIGAIYFHLTRIPGDDSMYGVGAMLIFVAVTGMLFVIDCLQIRAGSSSPAVILKVLEKIKKDPKYKKKGDSFFSPAEYEHMFPNESDEPLTAEELLSRDRTEYE